MTSHAIDSAKIAWHRFHFSAHVSGIKSLVTGSRHGINCWPVLLQFCYNYY